MRFAVLVSGEGRNLQALIDACADARIPGRIVGVVSNRPGVRALERAETAGIPHRTISHLDFADRGAFENALGATLDEWAPDVVLLAGFMRVLTANFVRRYEGQLLNVHPSLLPRHPGLRTHQRAIEAGDTDHGASVHFVTEDLDGGPVIIQGRVRVEPQDTPQSLSERVMNIVEVRIYPQVAAWLARGELVLRDGQATWRGHALQAPLQLHDIEDCFR